MNLQIDQSCANGATPLCCVPCPARTGICETLTRAQLRGLSETTVRRFIKAGSELMPLLADGQCAIIRTGTVRLARLMADGRQQIVGLRGPAEMLGNPLGFRVEMSVRATSDLELCIVPGGVISRLMEENRKLERRLYSNAVQEVDKAHEMLLVIGRKTARERVASFLVSVARAAAPGTGKPHAMALSRAEIADYLGLTLETISRQLNALRREQIIDLISTRHFTVLDHERLSAAAGH